jgi:hypothetical protein
VDLRFLEISEPRQAFIRQCQWMGFGKIVGLEVRDGEPVFAPQTQVFMDLKLDNDDAPRPEHNLTDYVLCAEIVRFFSRLEAIRNGVIEHIEVRAGIPRRVVFKLADFTQSQSLQSAAHRELDR